MHPAVMVTNKKHCSSPAAEAALVGAGWAGKKPSAAADAAWQLIPHCRVDMAMKFVNAPYPS